MHDIEAWLLEDRPPRLVHLRHADGPAAYEEPGVEHVVLRSRRDADDPGQVSSIRGAGLIYLSGDDAGRLSTTLRGSAVWAAVVAEWRLGAALAGCGAGAMALGGYVPDVRHPKRGGTDGLGIVPDLRVLPHFDTYSRMIPDSALRPLVVAGATVVGIDEDTALVAEGPNDDGVWEFRSRGRQSCWRIDADRKYRVNAPLRLRVSG